MLRLGAMGAAGALISSSGASQTLGLRRPAAARTRSRSRRSRSAPVLTAPAGIDPQLFARAKAALDQHRIYARDTIGIVDFSKPSAEPRFHLVDLASGQVESHRVAHGRGSDPAHSGYRRALLQRLRLLRDARTAPTRPAIITRASTAFR